MRVGGHRRSPSLHVRDGWSTLRLSRLYARIVFATDPSPSQVGVYSSVNDLTESSIPMSPSEDDLLSLSRICQFLTFDHHDSRAGLTSALES